MSFASSMLRRHCGTALTTVLALAVATGSTAAQSGGWLTPYREVATRLVKAATADDFAWRRLAELTDTHGARLSGSDNLNRAIAWAAQTMRTDGLDNVHTERVMVPHWVRGEERGEIIEPARHQLVMLGLGGTIATPADGLEGEVLTVRSFEELRAKSAQARGKIVLFDVPYTGYAETVTYRTGSARAAAQVGGIAVLVRAIGPTGLRTPHTGSVQYSPDQPRVPAASISAEDTNRIARLQARGQRVRVRLSLQGHDEPDAESANVVGEIRGREKPDEIVLLGGHLDSWDVGAGASDDGVGCIVTWEALRLMKKLNIRPRRTVRLVLWTNEENGLRGANRYGEVHAAEAHNHVFALESDSGVFAPATLGFSGTSAARRILTQLVPLLAPLGFTDIVVGGGGADIAPIAQAGNVPTMALLGNPTPYFVIHHTAADTVERIDPNDVSHAAAAIALVTYIVAEMPERLPR